MNNVLPVMSWLGRKLGICLIVIALSFTVTAAAVGVYWHMRGGTILAVQTGSMVPIFAPGDAVVSKPVAHDALRVGDIISYQSQLQPSATISHRIIAIDTDARTVTTRGDHLQKPDTPIAMNAIRGRVSVLLPKFGYVLTLMHKPIGLVAVVYLPATGLVGYELMRLNGLRQQARDHYVLAGYRPHLRS